MITRAEASWVQQLSLGVKPPARSYLAMAYDSARGKVVVFGGDTGGMSIQDTWEWDTATGEWVDRTPLRTKPSARQTHAMVYDSARGRVVLFGGAGGEQVQPSHPQDRDLK